ncbi:trimeric intracellular cation channel family protein [Amphibiibacter pelophylacis]|uniref:Trimeric intracellular cation channel family protein n=1 Tax=Amphibiibacter pelophylacis TaxID=1799477 RepID=A0ACC6P0I4_9BURK
MSADLALALPAHLPADLPLQAWGQTLQLLVELGGTAAFALSGVMEAARKRLDPVGVCVVGCLAAFGGGTVRDLLLDQRPFFWVSHESTLWAVLLLCALSMLFLRDRHFSITERAMLWPDALGLGLFTAAGVHQSIAADMPALVTVLLGVITGTFGGVLRDMVCNEIPAVLKDHRPYALCAFAGAWLCLGLVALGLPGWISVLACVALTAGSRGLAVRRGWQIPHWRSGSPGPENPHDRH